MHGHCSDAMANEKVKHNLMPESDEENGMDSLPYEVILPC